MQYRVSGVVQNIDVWIALWDAKDEAADVAGNCGGSPGDPFLVTHQRILAHLEKRAEQQKSAASAELRSAVRFGASTGGEQVGRMLRCEHSFDRLGRLEELKLSGSLCPP